jgi:hypothetical protein
MMERSVDHTLTMVLVGDLILDEPDPDSFFDPSRAVFRAADVAVGHVEVPFTNRAIGEAAANPGRDPAKLAALSRAGFHVATLAANHIFDAGEVGVEDTLAALHALNIPTAGAGMNLDEARQPAVIERGGLRFGFLSYNCVGPKESWASVIKAGGAYVEIITHYELDYAGPGGPPRIFTFAEPETLAVMQADIERLRAEVDILTVALHKGLGHTPVKLAQYERVVARAAIDAGADIVVSHHAHILHGIEVYRNRPIFHGLGNFVTVTRVLNVEENPNPAALAWAQRRRELFGFEPDPAYPTYAFHPEAKNTMIAVCEVSAQGVQRAGFIPCWVNPRGVPEVLGHDERGQAVARYIERITREAGLNAEFRWEDEKVWFLP